MALRYRAAATRAAAGGSCAIAIAEYAADEDSRVSFAKGEVVVVLDSEDVWWLVRTADGAEGKAPSNFECVCESPGPYCKNCYRWWMSVALQSLISLNRAVPSHVSLNRTQQMLDGMRLHSPYSSHAAPS